MNSPMRRFTSSLLALAAVIATLAAARLLPLAVDRAAPPAAAAPAQPTAPIPSGWLRVDTGAFSVSLPPGWEYVPRQGIDSFVGQLVGGDMRLFFDYGMYSNPLATAGDPGYEVTFECVGGKQAKLVVAKGAPARVTGVFFPEARVSDFGTPGPPVFDMLEVHGVDLSATQQELALTIFRSVRFPGVWLASRGAWEPVAVPDGYLLNDVRMLSAEEGWAVGGLRVESQDSVCGILHYAGGRWIPVECPAGDIMFAVDMSLPTEGWRLASTRSSPGMACGRSIGW